jgi:small subunit ribosomal protein S1
MTNEVNKDVEVSGADETSAIEKTNAATTSDAASDQKADEAADEPQSMAEIDFGTILEQFEQEQTVYHAGELVEGKVVGVSDHGVLVDFGHKSEGVIPAEEFAGPNAKEAVSVGDTVEVVIKSIHSGDTPPLLSLSDAASRKIWNDVEEAFNEDRAVIGKIVDKTKGGLLVDLNGIEAFLPGSQIDSRPIRGLDSYIGQDIEAKVIKFSRRRNNIVLSRKVITDLEMNKLKDETLGNIDVGHIVDGVIKNLTEYGAFVDIGGIDGLLHVTDMSWGRIQNPGDHFKVGDTIQVKILKLDREKEKISLGYKQLLPDPWSTVVEVYPVDTKITGKVSSVTEYGIFVELEPGVEGLVHVSEISWSKRSANPKRMFHRGDDVEVQVLGVDTVEKRISLGMKQLQSNPWDDIQTRYPVGTKIHGRIRNLTDFGAFVELEEGIDGLVHVSDITWAKKLKHPKELLKKDQEVDAIVTNIDAAGQRLSLSMKDLTPSAWEGFVATHRPGDVVKGKVSRFTSFGIFVELEEGLEGLCHISELSDERIENAEQVAQLGQEMEFKILRIEPDEQKIGLSFRAVGKEDEPIVDTRSYTTEAKGGMASLGELANLKFGAAEEVPEEAPEPSKKERKKAKAKAAAEAEEAGESEVPATEETPAEAETETQAEATAETEVKAEETPAEPVVEAEEAAEPEQAEKTEEVEADVPAEETTKAADEAEDEAKDEESEEKSA